jgi:hypothetical protein
MGALLEDAPYHQQRGYDVAPLRARWSMCDPDDLVISIRLIPIGSSCAFSPYTLQIRPPDHRPRAVPRGPVSRLRRNALEPDFTGFNRHLWLREATATAMELEREIPPGPFTRLLEA